MKEISTKLLVIGGGPGGYVAAIRAGQLGIPTVLAEGASLGGTCLNIGCIPSKALIHAAQEFAHARQFGAGTSPLGIKVTNPQIDIAQTVRWKDGIVARLSGGVGALLRKAGVQVQRGWAQIEDGKTAVITPHDGGEPVRVRCEHLLLATGSEPVSLPSMPFGSNGGAIWSSTDALSPDVLPKRLVVVGAGYIGLELGMAYRKLGVEVTVVEAAQRVLPSYDEELTQPVLEALKRSGVCMFAMPGPTNLPCRPSACWSPWAAARAPRALAWKGCSWTWPGALSRSMRIAAPPCAMSGPLAT